jgi:O-antigen/teichoic acid export membrane protein
MNLDIIFAKNLFDAETAGTYAGISVVAKFLIFLGGSVETVYYPQIMERKKESVPRHFLVNSFGMLLLLAASAVAFNGFFGAYVLELMHAGFGRHVDIFLLLLVFG